MLLMLPIPRVTVGQYCLLGWTPDSGGILSDDEFPEKWPLSTLE